jgi:hypothetical protein
MAMTAELSMIPPKSGALIDYFLSGHCVCMGVVRESSLATPTQLFRSMSEPLQIYELLQRLPPA